MGRIASFFVKRKASAALVILTMAGIGYWAASSNPTARAVDSGQFHSLEICLERLDYACVVRAAYKAMPFDQAKRRNHQIGMALAFAGDTDLAMATLKAEREYWRKTRIAGAIIARHLVSDSESDIGPVMYQLDSLVQKAISLQQAGSFLSKDDANTFNKFRRHVVSFVNESVSSGYEEELLRIDTEASSFALGNLLDALRLNEDPDFRGIIAQFASENARATALQVMEKRKVNHLKHVSHQVTSVAQGGGTQEEIIRLIRQTVESERVGNAKTFHNNTIRLLTQETASRNDQVVAKEISPAIETIADAVEQASCRASLYNMLAKMHARLGDVSDALRLVNKSLQLDLELVDSSGMSCLTGGGAYTLALAAAIGQPDAVTALEKKVSDISAAGRSRTANEAGRHLIFSLEFMTAVTPLDVRSKITDISVAFQELDGRTKAGKAELLAIGLTQVDADIPLWFKLARSAQKKYAAHDTDFPRRLNRPLLEAMTDGYAMSGGGWLNFVNKDSGSWGR